MIVPDQHHTITYADIQTPGALRKAYRLGLRLADDLFDYHLERACNGRGNFGYHFIFAVKMIIIQDILAERLADLDQPAPGPPLHPAAETFLPLLGDDSAMGQDYRTLFNLYASGDYDD